MSMSLQTIPRTAVRSWLSAVRLPLSAAERVVGKQGTDWPPAVVFEGFEAGVKRSVGNLIGDTQLVQEGTLERAKVSQLQRAAELEAAAERRREEAAARFEDRKETVQERDKRLEREQQEREAKLEQEKAERKRAVEASARKKEEAARKADEARKKAVAAQERQARATRLAAESAALDSEREAVAAKGEVLDVDRALNATKAARKRS
jgi:hypothetical protein